MVLGVDEVCTYEDDNVCEHLVHMEAVRPVVPRGPNTTLEQRILMIDLRAQDKTYTEIAQILGCGYRTVGRILNRWRREDEIKPVKASGRPKKLTETAGRNLLRRLSTDPFVALTDIVKEPAYSHVTSRTLSNYVNENSPFKTYWAARKPYIRDANVKKRLQWCEARKNWNVEDWDKVLWSDESP